MNRILLAPGRYIQGAGAIHEIGPHAARLGRNAFVVGGSTALSLCGEAIRASLARQRIGCHLETFGGLSSRKEIERLYRLAAANGTDLVVALGGGAAIDAAKAVSHEMDLPVIVIPTTAATDAPCSALSVIYSDEGVFDRYLYLRRNPDCVLVDTALIATSPAKFLIAGMGDAVAAFWETDTCARSGRATAFCGGDTPTLAVQALSRLCYDTLREYGPQAKLAVERRSVSPALEAVVEAAILVSGLCSENGGHAGAHAIHNGLTTLSASRKRLHGEKVAFGLLTQLVLENRPAAAIREVQEFCLSVGLPVCLADLDITDPAPDELRQVAVAATAPDETIHATWFPVTPPMVEAAMRTADTLGAEYKKELGIG